MEAIYAIDLNNGLSKNGIIPWKSKRDMSFFINKTKNNIVIMGKNTFFSIPTEHRPLKNRLNIVLTSTPHLYENNIINEESNVLFTNNPDIYKEFFTPFRISNAKSASPSQLITAPKGGVSNEKRCKNRNKYYELYKYLKEDFKIFVIGGKTIYEMFIPLCDTVWVTHIKCNYNCDLFIDYDYSKHFDVELYDENDELKIVKYTRL